MWPCDLNVTEYWCMHIVDVYGMLTSEATTCQRCYDVSQLLPWCQRHSTLFVSPHQTVIDTQRIGRRPACLVLFRLISVCPRTCLSYRQQDRHYISVEGVDKPLSASVKPRLHQICRRIQVLSSVLLADTSVYM